MQQQILDLLNEHYQPTSEYDGIITLAFNEEGVQVVMHNINILNLVRAEVLLREELKQHLLKEDIDDTVQH